MPDCALSLAAKKLPSPRTCAICGLGPCVRAFGKTQPPVDDAKVMQIWREVGLPEYFLGNGGTNHRLVEFARRCAEAGDVWRR